MPYEWHDMGDDAYFAIAGYEPIGGGWHDVEGKEADTPFEDSGYDLGDLDSITYHYTDQEGNDLWFHLDGPFEDYDSIAELIADALDRYGITGG